MTERQQFVRFLMKHGLLKRFYANIENKDLWKNPPECWFGEAFSFEKDPSKTLRGWCIVEGEWLQHVYQNCKTYEERANFFSRKRLNKVSYNPTRIIG